MLSTAFVALFPQKRKLIKSVSAGLDEHAEHSVGSSSCHQRPRGVMRHLSSIYAYAYIWVMRRIYAHIYMGDAPPFKHICLCVMLACVYARMRIYVYVCICISHTYMYIPCVCMYGCKDV